MGLIQNFSAPPAATMGRRQRRVRSRLSHLSPLAFRIGHRPSTACFSARKGKAILSAPAESIAADAESR